MINVEKAKKIANFIIMCVAKTARLGHTSIETFRPKMKPESNPEILACN